MLTSKGVSQIFRESSLVFVDGATCCSTSGSEHKTRVGWWYKSYLDRGSRVNFWALPSQTRYLSCPWTYNSQVMESTWVHSSRWLPQLLSWGAFVRFPLTGWGGEWKEQWSILSPLLVASVSEAGAYSFSAELANFEIVFIFTRDVSVYSVFSHVCTYYWYANVEESKNSKEKM